MGVIETSGLLVQAQPALWDLGVEGWATEGSSWEWILEGFTDASGVAFNYAGLTATTCTIYTTPGGSVVATLSTAWSTVSSKSRLRIYADDSATAGLAGTARTRGCYWGLKLTDATDTLRLWNPSNSPFHIESED